MNKLTVQEILDIIHQKGFSERDFAYGYFEYIQEIGKWEEVDQYGGEGQGDTWYSVKYFKDHDVYIRTDGWYSSYEGTEFEEGYGREVFPQQKTITVYN